MYSVSCMYSYELFIIEPYLVCSAIRRDIFLEANENVCHYLVTNFVELLTLPYSYRPGHVEYISSPRNVSQHLSKNSKKFKLNNNKY